MRIALIFITSLLVIGITGWVLGVYVSLDPNVSNWSEQARALHAYTSMAGALFITIGWGGR